MNQKRLILYGFFTILLALFFALLAYLPSSSASVGEERFPDGIVVRISGRDALYRIVNRGRSGQYIPSMEVLVSYGYTANDIFDIDLDDARKITVTKDPLSYRVGTFLKVAGTSPIYVVNNVGELMRVPSWDIFTAIGGSEAEIISVANLSGLTVTRTLPIGWYPNGALIKSANHPRVYLIENDTKRPIISMATFLSYGFRWERIRTVSDEVIRRIILGAPLTAPSGTLVQFPNDSAVYVVEENGSETVRRTFSPIERLRWPHAGANGFAVRPIFTLSTEEASLYKIQDPLAIPPDTTPPAAPAQGVSVVGTPEKPVVRSFFDNEDVHWMEYRLERLFDGLSFHGERERPFILGIGELFDTVFTDTLPAGNYVLYVRQADRFGNWSEERKIRSFIHVVNMPVETTRDVRRALDMELVGIELAKLGSHLPELSDRREPSAKGYIELRNLLIELRQSGLTSLSSKPLPLDPVNTEPYQYRYGSNGRRYTLAYVQESDGEVVEVTGEASE
ncbi:MAG: hypothetical protein HY459_00940 [Parcubacteria group bacterium]|nr:hypothetical protein [Parcubacteria group bacterium]